MRTTIGLLAAIAVLSGWGCVTSGAYDSVVKERDRYRTQLEGATRTGDRAQRDVSAMSSALHDRDQQISRDQAAIAELKRVLDALEKQLEVEIETGRVRVEQMRDGIRVSLSEPILFASGSAALGEGGKSVLRRIGEELVQTDYLVLVSGHTDNVAIGPRLAVRYPSNWELGAARAGQVVNEFERLGVPTERLVAISRSHAEPIASNDEPDGRQMNRRIEIRLRPSQ